MCFVTFIAVCILLFSIDIFVHLCDHGEGLIDVRDGGEKGRNGRSYQHSHFHHPIQTQNKSNLTFK